MSAKSIETLEPFDSLEFKIPPLYQGESLIKQIQKSRYSVSYILDHSIQKSWVLARDISKLVKIINPSLYSHFELKRGKNTWEIGNICTFEWNGFTKINCKVIYMEEKEFMKKISWYCKTKIGINYITTYYLYKISQFKKTLIKNIIFLDHTSNVEVMNFSENKDYYKGIHLARLKDFNEYLNNTDKKYSYVSCLINGKFLDIWNFVVNLKKMSEFFLSFGKNFELRNNKNEIGNFWKCQIPSYNKFCYVRIRNIIKNKNRWIYYVDTLGTINSIAQREMKIIVTKVGRIGGNEEKCQLSVAHLFKENISSEDLFEFEINNNTFLKKLQLYFINISTAIHNKYNKDNNLNKKNLSAKCKNNI